MKREIEIDDELLFKLEKFKQVFDVIMEEDTSFDSYLNAVIEIGIDRMLRDSIPKDQEWNTIVAAFERNYETMSKLVADIWKKGKHINEEEKKRIKDDLLRYIQ